VSRIRTAARIDENQPEIVKQMRKVGLEVEIIGLPSDLLVARNRVTVVVEVKNPDKSPSERRLTDAELIFYTKWHHKALYCVIETDQDVIDLNRAMTKGINASVKYCEENMRNHFDTCYAKRK
jgi:hypothetical protein